MSYSTQPRRGGSVSGKSLAGRGPLQARNSRPKGDARRKALLDAAQALLETASLETLTYRAVCERARIPESSAYHFFPDLLSVYRALLARLGAEHDKVLEKPITRKQAASWQAIVSTAWDRSTAFHKACPAHAKLTISGKVPYELKHIDRAADRARNEFVMREIDRFFVLPRIENLAELFYIGAQLGDQVLILSMLEHGKLTAPMIAHAKVAMTSFLARYIGETLQPRPEPEVFSGKRAPPALEGRNA